MGNREHDYFARNYGFVGLGENEERARAVGYDTFRYKLAAFAESGIPEDVVTEKMGIREKHVCPPDDDHVTDMCVEAAGDALDDADVDAKDVDLVLYHGSEYKDYVVWSAAANVAERLGAAAMVLERDAGDRTRAVVHESAAITHMKRSFHDWLTGELGLAERDHHYLDEYGHVQSVDQLLALDEGLAAGSVEPGDVVLFLAAGTGYTWAATVLEWQG